MWNSEPAPQAPEVTGLQGAPRQSSGLGGWRGTQLGHASLGTGSGSSLYKHATFSTINTSSGDSHK